MLNGDSRKAGEDQKGEGTILIRLLEHKFKTKTLPEHYRRQIEKPAPEHLLKWAEKVLGSESLEEIFTN